MVPMVLTHSFFYACPGGAHCVVSFPPFEGFAFCAQANEAHLLFIVGGAGDAEVVVHLKDPPFEFILVFLEFARGGSFASYQVIL